MVVQERSAGVIVFRESPAEFLLLDYGRYWDYPKGHLEKGESDEVAARRELLEETGIGEVELVPGFTHEISYFYRSKRGLMRKSVVFFLGRVSSSTVVQLSDEHVGFEWLPYEAAMQRVRFASARDVLSAANDYLNRT